MQTLTTEPAASCVYCYSGSTYAEGPRALDWEGKHYLVDRVETTWRTPEGPAFQVQTKPGSRFALRYHESEDRWTIQELLPLDEDAVEERY